MNWLVLSLLAMLFWGIWGFLLKIALNYFTWQQTLLLGFIGSLLTYIIFFTLAKPQLILNRVSVLGILAGVLGIGGAITFYIALAKGRAAIVIPITSLYPAITAALALLILNEKITFLQGIGIGLAVVAIFLISYNLRI